MDVSLLDSSQISPQKDSDYKSKGQETSLYGKLSTPESILSSYVRMCVCYITLLILFVLFVGIPMASVIYNYPGSDSVHG